MQGRPGDRLFDDGGLFDDRPASIRLGGHTECMERRPVVTAGRMRRSALKPALLTISRRLVLRVISGLSKASGMISYFLPTVTITLERYTRQCKKAG